MATYYTTVEAISRKLRGRLDFAEAPNSSFGSASNIGSQQVDEDLLKQVMIQEQALLDLTLGQIYEIPLQLTSPITKAILANLLECLVISQLMRTHYQGSFNSSGGDIQGLGIDAERQAYRILASLTAGHNIYLPSTDAPPANTGFQTPPQPLILPLEVIRILNQPDTITRNYSAVGFRRRNGLTTVDYYGYDQRNPYARRAIQAEILLNYNLPDSYQDYNTDF